MANKIKQISVYLKYQTRIYQYFWYRLEGDRELAEDMCSEVFCRMIRMWDTYDKEKSALPWLIGISRNVWCNYLRELGRECSLEHVQEPYVDEQDDWLNKLELEEAIRAINNLTESYKDILLLRYLEGLEYNEIAELLGKEEGAIRVQLCRARKKLKSIIKK